MRIGRPRSVDLFEMNTVKVKRRRSDDSIMGCAKAEDAMGTLGMLGIVERCLLHIPSIVPTKLEKRRFVGGGRRQGEAAERDEQGLSGDSVRYQDANHRPPKAARH
jgi:hypothetical protein